MYICYHARLEEEESVNGAGMSEGLMEVFIRRKVSCFGGRWCQRLERCKPRLKKDMTKTADGVVFCGLKLGRRRVYESSWHVDDNG